MEVVGKFVCQKFLVKAAVLFAVASVIIGCAHYPQGACCPKRHTMAMPEALLARYSASDSYSVEAELVSSQSGNPHSVMSYKLTVPLLKSSGKKEIGLDCYIPEKGDKLPVIIILPKSTMGYVQEKGNAEYFVARGFIAVIVDREKVVFPRSPGELNTVLEQSIMDNRLVIDWLIKQPRVDPARIGVLGLSMGAIKASLLAAVEPRVRVSVVFLPGCDLPKIVTHSREDNIVRIRREYIRSKQISAAEFKRQLDAELVCDPKFLAQYIPPEKVLMFLARFDTVVLYSTGLELRNLMGGPETYVLWSGHCSAFFGMPFLRRQSLKFFQERLGNKSDSR